MKKYLILFIVMSGCTWLLSTEVMNPDLPERGTWDFNLQKVWQADTAGQNLFLRVSDIEVEANGTLYIFDRRYEKVLVLDKNGQYLCAFGKKGEGPGEYKRADDVILLTDQPIIPEAGRAHFFATDGKHLKSIRFPHEMTPSHFIGEDSFIYYHNRLGKQGEITADEIRFYRTETKEDRLIAEFSAAKEVNLDSGDMRISVHVDDVHTCLAKDILYMTKGDRYLVKRYSLKDKSTLSFGIKGRQQKKISMAWKKKRYGDLKINGRKMPDPMIKKMIEGMPDLSEFITRIMVDEKGLIYALVGDAENEVTQEVDIFSPDGRYLYHGELRLPDSLKFDSPRNLEIKNGFLYAFAWDKEEEGSIIKCRIALPRLK